MNIDIDIEDILEEIPTEDLVAELARRGLVATDPLEFTQSDFDELVLK